MSISARSPVRGSTSLPIGREVLLHRAGGTSSTRYAPVGERHCVYCQHVRWSIHDGSVRRSSLPAGDFVKLEVALQPDTKRYLNADHGERRHQLGQVKSVGGLRLARVDPPSIRVMLESWPTWKSFLCTFGQPLLPQAVRSTPQLSRVGLRFFLFRPNGCHISGLLCAPAATTMPT